MTSAHTPRNRREADTLARLLALLADGVAFDTAVWSVTDRGREMDTARLVDLFNGHRHASAAPGAPVATSATSASATPGPWHHDRSAILTADGRCIATAFSSPCASLEEADANGHLIAAAPELLRVACLALEELEWLGALASVPLRVDLRRAIAHAQGPA